MRYSLSKLSEKINYYLLAIASNKNKEDLIKKYPKLEIQIEELSKNTFKYINWLHDRFIVYPPKKDEVRPIEDSIVTLLLYSKADAGLSTKYKQGDRFTYLIDKNFPGKVWSNPSEISSLTIDDMEKILKLSESKAAKVEIKPTNLEADKVGKVGEWNLWLPSSRDNSIAIAQYDFDPESESYEPKTTWCTARISASNVFYNYSSRPGIILFYIIRDNAQKERNEDFLSFAFEHCSPLLDSGMTVDRARNKLSKEKFISILGESTYYKILDIFTQKCNSLGGVSPAMKKIEDSAKDVAIYKKMIAGNSRSERSELSEKIIEFKGVSPEVLDVIANDINKFIRGKVARHSNTDQKTLLRLSNDEDNHVRSEVAENRNSPPEALLNIVNTLNDTDNRDHGGTVHRIVDNWNTPPEALAKLVSYPDEGIKKKLSYDERMTPEALDALLISLDNIKPDAKKQIERRIAEHYDLLPQTLERLSNSTDEEILKLVAANRKTPTKVLYKLSLKDNPISVIKAVATNNNAPSSLLMSLYNLGNEQINLALASNPNTPVETLKLLAKNADKPLIANLTYNSNTPSEELENFSKIDSLEDLSEPYNYEILYYISIHPNATTKALSNVASKIGFEDNLALNLINHPNTSSEIKANLVKKHKVSFVTHRADVYYKLATN